MSQWYFYPWIASNHLDIIDMHEKGHPVQRSVESGGLRFIVPLYLSPDRGIGC